MEKAFSKDGYIINQMQTTSIFYGKYSSDYNGCGWISVYNLLRAGAKDVPYEQVHQELERGLHFGGKLGTGPWHMLAYLKEHHIQCKCSYRYKKTEARAKGAKGGIIAYWTGKGPHYVAFVRGEEMPKFRFFNAILGVENHVDTMEHFLETYSKFPLVFAMIWGEDGAKGDNHEK